MKNLIVREVNDFWPDFKIGDKVTFDEVDAYGDIDIIMYRVFTENGDRIWYPAHCFDVEGWDD